MLPSVPYVRHTELFLPLPSQLPLNHTLPTGSPFAGGPGVLAVFQIVPTAAFMDTLRIRGPTPVTTLVSTGQ